MEPSGEVYRPVPVFRQHIFGSVPLHSPDCPEAPL
jgi:hypothetical protein